jgi:hypothetical protein
MHSLPSNDSIKFAGFMSRQAGDSRGRLTRFGLALDALFFALAESRHRLVHQRVRAGAAEVLEHVRERLPLDQLHGVVVAAVVLPGGVDGDDVGVVQLRRGVGLALEPLHRLWGQPEPRWQHLERDAAVERDLPGLVDHAHPATPDLAQ